MKVHGPEFCNIELAVKFKIFVFIFPWIEVNLTDTCKPPKQPKKGQWPQTGIIAEEESIFKLLSGLGIDSASLCSLIKF
jgi:hypothetical protein